MNNQFIKIDVSKQIMYCYNDNKLIFEYRVSTGKNGIGEKLGSGCTPRGLHCIHSKIGLNNLINSVFISREWTGEIYTEDLAKQYPDRDWILTRILQLDGLEEGKNKGGDVDSLSRYIYIHGTPDSVKLGKPGSKGCIRMNNQNIIELTNWVEIGAHVYISA
jgi:hypothetical protein